jgi:hypothetical protein
MIGRRASVAGIATKPGNHGFRATEIRAYLENGGTWRRRRRWRTTPPHARHSATITGAKNSASMVERIRV